MATYKQLCKTARKMGHILTPELQADLRVMAGVSDDDVRVALAGARVKELARQFRVTPALMEQRFVNLKLN